MSAAATSTSRGHVSGRVRIHGLTSFRSSAFQIGFVFPYLPLCTGIGVGVSNVPPNLGLGWVGLRSVRGPGAREGKRKLPHIDQMEHVLTLVTVVISFGASFTLPQHISVGSWRFFPCVRLLHCIEFEYVYRSSGDRRSFACGRRVLVRRVCSPRCWAMY